MPGVGNCFTIIDLLALFLLLLQRLALSTVRVQANTWNPIEFEGITVK